MGFIIAPLAGAVLKPDLMRRVADACLEAVLTHQQLMVVSAAIVVAIGLGAHADRRFLPHPAVIRPRTRLGLAGLRHSRWFPDIRENVGDCGWTAATKC